MANAWTALIAAITGIAGLSGGVVAERFNLKVVAKTRRKDDLASLRDKFEANDIRIPPVSPDGGQSGPYQSSCSVSRAVIQGNAGLDRFAALPLAMTMERDPTPGIA